MSVPAPVAGHVDASYLLFDDAQGRSAVIEMAQAAGMACPWGVMRRHAATTRGVGELIADAVSRGPRRWRRPGGSATVDGGVGMLQRWRACSMRRVGRSSTGFMAFATSMQSTWPSRLRSPVRLVALSDEEPARGSTRRRAHVRPPEGLGRRPFRG
ncbi:MAG: glycerate kinase [Collinsella intestinalis]